MNSQEAMQEALATTRNEALAHAWGCAAGYRAEASFQRARADALQAELDALRKPTKLAAVENDAA